MCIMRAAPRVSQFLANKSLFITGGTGFIGKCLVEKLLRDCHDINRIYLLIRPRPSETCEERFQKYFNCQTFDRIRPEEKKWRGKVELVPGDITLPSCGLNPADKERVSSAEIVVHSAAAISFTLSLQKALTLNTVGTKNVLDLALSMKDIQAFVNISTAYAMHSNMLIDEKVYPTNLDPLDAIEIFQKLPTEWTNQLTPSITENRNTYRYSKHLAEKLVENYQDRLPVTVIRPGSVIAAQKEPYPGWNEKDSGTTAIFKAMLTGAYPSLLMSPKVHMPISPVDTVVNTVIAAAWRRATQPNRSFLVYNCVPTDSNKITYGDIIHWGVEWIRRNPYPTLEFYPHAGHTENRSVYLAKFYLLRLLPAYLYDTLVGANGKPESRVKHYQRLNKLNDVFAPFALEDRWFTTKNTEELNELLSLEDKELFPIDISQLEWKTFIKNYAMGMGTYTYVPGTTSRGTLIKLKVQRWAAKIMIFSPIWLPGMVLAFPMLAQ